MPDESVRDAIEAFRTAATSDDPRSARAWSTEAGWRSRADSAARLARDLSRGGLGLRVTGPTFEAPSGDRVAVRAEVVEGERVHDTVYVLLVQTPEGWRVEATAQHRTLVGLFLAGQHSPVLAVEDLPSEPAAAAWADEELARLRSGEVTDDRLASQVAQGATEVVVAGVHHLAPLSRSLVVFEARRPGDDVGLASAAVLQHTGDGLSVWSRGQGVSYDALLDGIEAAWDVQAATGGPEARADALVSGLLDQLLGLAGLGDVVPAGGARPILHFLSTEAREGRLPMADLLDPAALATVWGGDLAGRVERHVQGHVAELLGVHGIDPDALDPDSPAGAALVAEHADDIVRGLFRGVLLATAPGEVAPPPTESSPGVAAWIRAALRHMATER